MINRFIAATVIVGAVMSGAVMCGAGTAGATVPLTSINCAKAPQALARIGTLETKAAAWVTKADTRLTQAKANGNTVRVARIENRINRVEKWEAKGTTLEGKINARCPG